MNEFNPVSYPFAAVLTKLLTQTHFTNLDTARDGHRQYRNAKEICFLGAVWLEGAYAIIRETR